MMHGPIPNCPPSESTPILDAKLGPVGALAALQVHVFDISQTDGEPVEDLDAIRRGVGRVRSIDLPTVK